MKHLLVWVTAITVTTSPVTMIIACQNEKNTQDQTAYLESTFDTINQEIAKVAYLNHTNKYNFSTMVNSFVKPTYLKDLNDSIIIDENLHQYDRFDTVFNRYFNESYLHDNIKTNLQLDNDGIVATPNPIIGQLLNLGPMVIKMIKEKGLENILTLVNNSGLLSTLLSPGLLGIINQIVNKEVLTYFQNAFDDSIYIGLTYQEVLTSGSFGLFNAIGALTNSQQEVDYKTKANLQSTSDVYLGAYNNFGTTVSKIIKGEVKIEFDIIKNLKAVSEIIRFLRVTVVYLNEFLSFQATNWTEINTIRNKEFVADKEFDFFPLIKKFQDAFESKDGKGIRNLIAILFQSNSKMRDSPLTSLMDSTLPTAGLSSVLKIVLNNYINAEVLGQKLYIGNLLVDLLDSIATEASIKPIVTFLSSDFLAEFIPPAFKPMIDLFLKNPDVMDDIFKALYDGEFLTKLLADNVIVAKLKNIKTMLDNPLGNIVSILPFAGIDKMLAFLKNETITNITKKIVTNIKLDFKINWKDIVDLFKSLQVPTENNSWVLQDVLTNPNDFFAILGFKNDKIVPTSPLFFISKILNKTFAISEILAIFQETLTNFAIDQKNNLIAMGTELKKLKVIKLTNAQSYTFNYQINNKVIKIVIAKTSQKHVITEIDVN